MLENLLDLKYLNRDGDSMRGPLALSGDPVQGAHAVNKSYADRLIATLGIQALLRDGSLAMLGPLTLVGPPTAVLHAATMGYVDAVGADLAALRVYVDAQDALRLQLAGGTMTGVLTLAGAPVNPLEAATMAYADLMLPLAGGTMGGVLTLAADPLLAMQPTTKQYVDAIPTGQATYDAIVDAAGGADYTSIVTACATEAAGAAIFVVSGTYNETADIVMKDAQALIGQNKETTIIDFGAANRQILAAVGDHHTVKRFTLQGSTAAYTVDLQTGFSVVDECDFIGSATAGEGLHVESRSVVTRCYFTTYTQAGRYCLRTGANVQVINNHFRASRRGIYAGADTVMVGNWMDGMTEEQIYLLSNVLVTGNHLWGNQQILIAGGNAVISGNNIDAGANGIQWLGGGGGYDNITITGNYFDGSPVYCTNTGASDCSVSGNIFNGGSGVYIAGPRWSVTGNIFIGAAIVEFTANGQYAIVSGNNFAAASSAPAALITDAGVANTAHNNPGVAPTLEKRFLKMLNSSGGALVNGDVIVFNAAAGGDEFTTTVNQGDDLVWGMVVEAIGIGARGYIQSLGKTTALKANGTAAIAIGDLLGTLNAVKIGMKAAAGDMAFAIALEAYAGADSLGVIDALLITPRKV